MQITTLVFGQDVLIQSEVFQALTYWRIIWLKTDTRDILHKENGDWSSHTTNLSVAKKFGSIIDQQLAKQN